jgi:hypothetical protein
MGIESVTDLKNAVQRAKNEIYRADQAVEDMAELCAGKLKQCNVRAHVLKKLKRELANFNIHTGRWNE